MRAFETAKSLLCFLLLADRANVAHRSFAMPQRRPWKAARFCVLLTSMLVAGAVATPRPALLTKLRPTTSVSRNTRPTRHGSFVIVELLIRDRYGRKQAPNVRNFPSSLQNEHALSTQIAGQEAMEVMGPVTWPPIMERGCSESQVQRYQSVRNEWNTSDQGHILRPAALCNAVCTDQWSFPKLLPLLQ